ncbi:hypothetical protein NL676_008344 [Syzygium grande]|nr:hypothetical protein NL676_008344 [Syzygium grande]
MTDAECDAALVAGNVPKASVPRPSRRPLLELVVPLFGESVQFNCFVELYERSGMEWLDYPLSCRPLRNRRSPALRSAFQETTLSPANFVYPLFIREGEEDTPIGAMPGCYRLGWRHGLVEEVVKARDVGVNSIVLFPKSPTGDEAYNDNGLAPRTIRLLEDKYPDLVIYTDFALDPYSSDGHDGIVREDGKSLNYLHFKNVRFLANFITAGGIIIKRSSTHISAKAQRKVAREIKTA